ncbi:MAG: hypothetical protein A2X94_15690 [Bdellovibrionales bacterium GWB1_55_8]|nr:MAG: hypothetical protein A2X94_15690 [Bdellovibrionales bacterium GWB1_55_8]
MSSTLTQSGVAAGSSSTSHKLDRKGLRRPDQFLAFVSQLFKKFSEHRQAMLVVLAVLVTVAAVTAFWTNRQETKTASAQAALFDAQKSLGEELKKVAVELAPPVAPAPKAKAKGETAKTETPAPNVNAILFTRFDVEQKLPETVKKLKKVVDEFGGTSVGYEANLLLGDLFFDHGESGKAVPWYSQAASTTSVSFHRALALQSLGYAYENDSKPAEALAAYEKALGAGAADLKGDLLLATARSHVALNDQAKARSTYDQILSQMPDTEFAKTARVLKDELR